MGESIELRSNIPAPYRGAALSAFALKPLDRAIVGFFLVVANAHQYQIAIEIGEPPLILVVVNLIDSGFDICVEFEFDDNGRLLNAFFGQ